MLVLTWKNPIYTGTELRTKLSLLIPFFVNVEYFSTTGYFTALLRVSARNSLLNAASLSILVSDSDSENRIAIEYTHTRLECHFPPCNP